MGNFGFIPNTKMKIWQNIRKVIGNMTLKEHYSHNTNMKCHNLCTKKPPPTIMVTLLGLGAKFCLQSKTIDVKKIKEMISRFKHDIRVNHYIISNRGYSDKSLP